VPLDPCHNGTILAMTPASALLAALLLPIQIGVAGAAPEPGKTTVHLEVRASADCATRSDLIARVAARSPRIQFVDSGSALAGEAVFTAGRSGNVVGELVLSGPGGRSLSRRLLARSCVEAADAVALIIAVTLDPTFAGDRDVAAGAQTEATSLADRSASPSTAPTARPSPIAEPTLKPAEQPAERALDRAVPVAANPVVASSPAPAPPEAARRRVGAHLAGQTIFGPAPAVMPGISVYAIAALDRDALWSPAIMVGVTHAWRNSLAEPGGTASFTLDAASLDTCALRLRLSVIEARACGSALVGRLSARGDNTSAPATVARPFVTIGGAAVLTAGLGSIVELSARLGAGLTLLRDSYEFAPTIFYRADRITTSASLGIGARLP
jgi:hypothetical protein